MKSFSSTYHFNSSMNRRIIWINIGEYAKFFGLCSTLEVEFWGILEELMLCWAKDCK